VLIFFYAKFAISSKIFHSCFGLYGTVLAEFGKMKQISKNSVYKTALEFLFATQNCLNSFKFPKFTKKTTQHVLYNQQIQHIRPLIFAYTKVTV
jgi:hypothetical protein